MSFFDDSHVTDVGLRGSAGPSVGLGEMVAQSFRQQYRVDSARALDEELRNRWLESLRAAQIRDQVNIAPDPLGRNPSLDPDDPWAYRAFAQHVSGQPVDTFDPNKTLVNYDPTARIKGMIDANEKIKALNNPNIKSFEQILEEVSQMQHEVEGETASMYERTGRGGFVASLLGAMAGSFTTRDPLNLITAPIGAGRTAVMRIATDMGVAGAVTGYTELSEVAPARRIAGLPERDPLLNIAAATLGAGVIRGGIEGIGYGVRSLRTESIDFDLRDSQLAQMFEANSDKPSARAGASILDDVKFVERNNPYGEGHQANVRFLAELQSVQRAMNGEPMTAVARVLPPMPFEYIEKQANFAIVKEQRPWLYRNMEVAQERLQDLTRQIDEVASPQPISLVEAVRLVDEKAASQLEQLSARVNDEALPEPVRAAADIQGQALIQKVGIEKINKAVDDLEIPKRYKARSLRASRRAANREYRAAYRAVEAEAGRIREQQARVEAAQQRETSVILASEGLPFTGPILRYDTVEALTDRINKFNDNLDERSAARFVRETLGEGENKVEVEVWEKEGGIDIGLRDPVDPKFTFMTDEGEMTVAQAMRDLQDDTDLVEAIKGCAI